MASANHGHSSTYPASTLHDTSSRTTLQRIEDSSRSSHSTALKTTHTNAIWGLANPYIFSQPSRAESPPPLLPSHLPSFPWTDGAVLQSAEQANQSHYAITTTRSHKPPKATKRKTHRTIKLKLCKLRKTFYYSVGNILTRSSKAWPFYACSY